jgi:spore coat polysaccharide biosynthesis protein SpsF
MRIVAIIQARMGSTRLPGKVLMDLGGETALARVVRRVRRASLVDEVVVATTESASDDAVVDEAGRLNAGVFRGSERDVLDRYHAAAKHFGAEAVVRVTSDCPLIDAALTDDLIKKFLAARADFACNVWPRTYPRGLDAEVFTAAALSRVRQMADQPHQREHVTPLFYERQDLFSFTSVCGDADYSHHRWTLDTPEDLQLIRRIYAGLNNRGDFGWREALALVANSPELSALNSHVAQKPMLETA